MDTFVTIWTCVVALGTSESAAEPSPLPEVRVEVEEEVYRFTPAQNGAGPMWCHGNTCVARVGDDVFASGLETIPGAKPLNNCVPLLFRRADPGWELVFKGKRRTREPSPVAAFPDGRVFLSVNPTLTEPDTYGGPAEPQILEFRARDPREAVRTHRPRWNGKPAFTEHSYRSFAADGARKELILFQNVGYTHAEWSFRGSDGRWPAQGKLVWPWGAEYDKPQPIRVCYPTVALKGKAVHFCGVSDIVEPYAKWRAYKKKLTGRDWDYDFRRLFYTWTDDITTGEFREWVEVSSRDKTAGWIFPQDLHVGGDGDVFLLWTERAIDERLREEFFPGEKQRHSLEYAVLRQGKVLRRTALVEGGDEHGGRRPGDARFHVTADGRLFAVYHVGGTDESGERLSENRLVELGPRGARGPSVRIQLEQPLPAFFAATVRAGGQPSDFLDLLGSAGGSMRYVRVRILR